MDKEAQGLVTHTVVLCTLMQVKTGELTVEEATTSITEHIEERVQDALEDVEHESSIRRARQLIKSMRAQVDDG